MTKARFTPAARLASQAHTPTAAERLPVVGSLVRFVRAVDDVWAESRRLAKAHGVDLNAG